MCFEMAFNCGWSLFPQQVTYYKKKTLNKLCIRKIIILTYQKLGSVGPVQQKIKLPGP